MVTDAVQYNYKIKLIQMPNERSTDMKYNNIEDIRKSVRACAEFHGFEVKDAQYTTLGISIKTETGYVRIDVYSDFSFDFENKVATDAYEFCPTICKMGGKNTPEEFREIANEMLKAANLVEALNFRGGYQLVTEIPAKAE